MHNHHNDDDDSAQCVNAATAPEFLHSPAETVEHASATKPPLGMRIGLHGHPSQGVPSVPLALALTMRSCPPQALTPCGVRYGRHVLQSNIHAEWHIRLAVACMLLGTGRARAEGKTDSATESPINPCNGHADCANAEYVQ